MAGPVHASGGLEPSLAVYTALIGVPVFCSATSLLLSLKKSMRGKGNFLEVVLGQQ